MSTVINLTQENLKELASKVGGNLWMKGDKIRIYVTGGNNYHYDGKWHYEINTDGSWETKCWLSGGYTNSKSKEYVAKHLAIMDQEMENALNDQATEGEAIVTPELPISAEIIATMACTPVRIVENEHYNPKNTPIKFVANLSDSNMIDYYHGCGEGIAYVKGADVIAFKYGRDGASNEPVDAKRYFVEFSCTQICFRSL